MLRHARPLATALAAAALCHGAAGCEGGGPGGPDGTGPRIRAVTPSRAIPGQIVALVGSGFGTEPSRVAVTFDGVPSEIATVTPDTARVVVPESLAPGEVGLLLTVEGQPEGATARLTVVAPGPAFRSLSAGSGFTCGVREAGGATCWGIGTSGQLGSGALGGSPFPFPVQGGAAFESVAAGSAHACALDAAGAAFCWGRGEEGQLGTGRLEDSLAPVAVAGGLAFTRLTAGIFHTCGLTAGGAAWCWGGDASGQLGDGGVLPAPVSALPVQVAGARAFTALSAGGLHTCALEAGGSAWCWGEGTHGELGDGSATDSPVPVPVSGGLTFTEVSAGRSPPVGLPTVGEHTCGIDGGGRPWCWGFNADGQLGNGSTSDAMTPTPVAGGLALTAVAAGAFHTCGLDAGGDAWCWGANDSGQLGNGASGAGARVPAPVEGGLRFRAVSAGGASKSAVANVRAHTCALTLTAAAFCWGRNGSGQLGDGTNASQAAPVPVAGP